jgi:hypothetical protein
MQAYECLTVANVYEHLLCCHALCCESESYNLHQVIRVFPNGMPNSTVFHAHFSQPARKRCMISTSVCFFFLDVVFCGRTVFSRRTDCQEPVKIKNRRSVVYGNIRINERRLCNEMSEA